MKGGQTLELRPRPVEKFHPWKTSRGPFSFNYSVIDPWLHDLKLFIKWCSLMFACIYLLSASLPFCGFILGMKNHLGFKNGY